MLARRLKTYKSALNYVVPRLRSPLLVQICTALALVCLNGCSGEKLEQNLMPAPAISNFIPSSAAASATCAGTSIISHDNQRTENVAREVSPAAQIPTLVDTTKDGKLDRTGISQTEIKIGSCCAVSGPAGLLGQDLSSGAQIYFNYINEHGGIYGRKIKLFTYDDGYEPNRALTCFDKLMKEKVFAGAFFVGSPLAARYVPMTELNAVPLIGVYSGAELLYTPLKPHVFNIRASYADETRAQVDNLWAAGKHKIAIIYQDDAFGANVLKSVRAALAKHKSAPIAFGAFARNTVLVDDALEQVRGSQPDAVILVGAYAPLAQIVKRSHKLGWKPLFVTVSFVNADAFIKEAGKDAEGTIITQVLPLYTREDLPAVALYRSLLSRYYPERQPSFVSLEGFVDAMVLVDGLKAAGPGLTRSGLINALERFENKDIGLGNNLKLNFSRSCHKGSSAVYSTVVKNQKSMPLSKW